MNKTAGQVTILVLLLSLLGLTIVLSLASRSLSDLKQVTYVDAGTRTLAGAEAGLQYALSESNNWSTFGFNLNNCADSTKDRSFPGTLSFVSSAKYRVCLASGQSSTLATNVPQDDVVEIDLSGANPNLKAFDVSWDGTTASVEIEVVDKDTGTNAYSIRRYAYNPVASNKGGSNGFATALAGTICNGDGTICPSSAYSNCTGASEICYHADCAAGTKVAQLVRIKPLYSSASVSVCGRDVNSAPVLITGGASYYRVIVTATSINGTVRRIQSDRSPVSSGLPAIFDNVFYTGGSISK